MHKLAAEAFGTFWLVFGGCGSAVLAAGFPELGIGFVGVALAFGLTVLTMAYAVGHISGGHFNPAVSLGLAVGGRFSWSELIPYWIAQVVGGIVAAVVLYLIASGKADWTAGGFASNGYGANSPGGYGLFACFLIELVLTAGFVLVILGATSPKAPGRLRRHRHRPRADAHPPRLDPGDQHLGQPGPLHRRRLLRRDRRRRPALALLGGAARSARRSAA